MRSSIIARNYAQTLLALAERHGGRATVEEYGDALDALAESLRTEPRLREFLETPRIDAEAKKQVLRTAFSGRVPDLFLRFLLVVVDKRRQNVLEEIAAGYSDLVDEELGRVRAEITVAREPDEALKQRIVSQLEARFDKSVVPEFRIDENVLGGLVIRIGDNVLDGSVRTQLKSLKRQLMKAKLPAAAA